MINLNKYFDKKIIENRNNLNKEKVTSEITIDINEDLYEKLLLISNEKDISIEDLIIDSFHFLFLEQIEKPKEINNIIDTATFLSYSDEILDSNENYLLVDSTNLDNKSILITNKIDLKNYEDLKNENKI